MLNKIKYVEDLSYSNLVNLIQGEEIKAADLLSTFASELETVRKEILELESKINCVKSREQSLLKAGQDVATHLKKDLPLAVKRQSYIVVLSKDNLTIDRNVI